MTPQSRKRLFNVVRLLAAAALVVVLVSTVNVQDYRDAATGELRKGLLSYWREIDVGLFLLGSLFYFVAASFSAVRWWWLLRVNDLPVNCWQALRFTWIGIFFNNVVPGLTGGDVVKAVYVARATGKKLRPILSVVVDRVLGLIALALLAAVVVLFRLEGDFVWVAIGLWGGLAALVAGTSLFLSRRVRSALLRRLPMSQVLMQFDQALTHYRGHLPGILVWLVISAVNHLVAVIGVILINDAMHGSMPVTEMLILVPIINIVSAVPIAPSGWGVGDLLYRFLWERFGTAYMARTVAGEQGLALSIVYRVHMMIWSLLGAVFLAREKGRPSEEEMTDLMDEIVEAERSDLAEPPA